MDYQEQFFKMWNDNMEKMLDSDAYKAMTKNIPGADAYTKAMESMVPTVEKYWKDMAAAMPQFPTTVMPGMDYWTNMMSSNPYMDYWKSMMSSNPYMDYWKDMAGKMPGMDVWNNWTASNPVMDYWKDMAGKMPDMSEYWKSLQNMMPDMAEYWNSFTNMIPGMSTYWDNFAKMMPNPELFKNMAPFNMPGLDAFTKIFDMWKSFGDPNAMVQDFQKKYMDATAEVIKSLFPANVQPFVSRPIDFMNMMVEYYKQIVSPWMEIDADIMERLAQGDPDAYIDFFKDYQKKYEEELEKYFTIMGMGLNREANEDYMKLLNQWNKAMISMGELMAVVTKTGQESFEQIADKVQNDLADGKTITTFRDFYTIWYTVTEDAYEKLLATDEFAQVFDDFADRYSQYMIAQNKVLERMLSGLPIPTNTDMKALYRTVYDLRKDVRDLKKAVAAKEEKKGDK
jgi:class III poly(R)-hydroxyalkanoic acid synthase PhaE subunit